MVAPREVKGAEEGLLVTLKTVAEALLEVSTELDSPTITVWLAVCTVHVEQWAPLRPTPLGNTSITALVLGASVLKDDG